MQGKYQIELSEEEIILVSHGLQLMMAIQKSDALYFGAKINPEIEKLWLKLGDLKPKND